MPKLTIDDTPVQVEPGATILDAARKLGIGIPTLCFLEGHPPQTSCMVCLVKVDGDDKLLPACATRVRDGMRVESECDEVRHARRTALELLLSDHLGDCIAPCQAACPAHIDIPLMIRQIAAGRRIAAGTTDRCRTCHAPCEKVCRRAVKDAAVSIRLLGCWVAGASGPGTQVPAATPEKQFSVHIGRVDPAEIGDFMAGASEENRVRPANGASFTEDEARREALRCLHCDCRRQTDCKLRKYAAIYGASPAKYKGERRRFLQAFHPENVIYEPGKCIACGLCVQITQEAAEPLGLTFIGRGFNVKVAVPFDRSLEEGLRRAAAECVAACPTGALAFKDDTQEA